MLGVFYLQLENVQCALMGPYREMLINRFNKRINNNQAVFACGRAGNLLYARVRKSLIFAGQRKWCLADRWIFPAADTSFVCQSRWEHCINFLTAAYRQEIKADAARVVPIKRQKGVFFEILLLCIQKWQHEIPGLMQAYWEN